MKTIGLLLLAALLLAGAFGAGWATAREQGKVALAEARRESDRRANDLLILVSHAEGTAQLVQGRADSLKAQLARLRAARPRVPGSGTSVPIVGTTNPSAPLAADTIPTLVEDALAQCDRLAGDCAALADSTTALGLQIRRYATTIDSLLAVPVAPAPTVEVHAGGFTTGVAVGAGGAVALGLAALLLFGH